MSPLAPNTEPLPLVSIVVVHLDGTEQLLECLGSVREQTYPAERLEVILVDNGSTDGSTRAVAERHPDVRIVELETNRGFAAGVNAGAKAANGEILGFLNDDARAHPDWVTNGVDALLEPGPVAATASRILSEDGSTLDFAEGGATFAGKGLQLDHGEAVPEEGSPVPTLFACGAAMFVRRDVFLDAGGFDEEFFAYYEDVDFGWRLWVLGHTVLTAPRSVVYHRHHGTAEHFAEARRLFHLERNALAVVYKNLAEEHLGTALAGAALLTGVRASGDLDPAGWGFDEPGLPPEVALSPTEGAALAGLRAFVERLPGWAPVRAAIQERRRRSDDEILPLLREPFVADSTRPGYEVTFRGVVAALGLDRIFGRRSRVLVVTEDVVGQRMAGPGIRALEIAKHLAVENEVILLSGNEPERSEVQGVAVERLTSLRVDELLPWADVVLIQGFVLLHHPQIGEAEAAIVVDLYDPFHLEGLELHRTEHLNQQAERAGFVVDLINAQLQAGDFFICASEKQRDMWVGHLTAIGRVTPGAYRADPTLRRLVDVVPFGVPGRPAERTGPGIRCSGTGIEADDRVILWGGGVYDWLDPHTVVRAMAKVVRREPRAKLYFLGTAHPSPGVPVMPVVASTRRLVRELDLEENVVFNADWVPYDERVNVFLDADIGVTAHRSHAETDYAFRTRVLDYFWTGLPVVTSSGDEIAAVVERHGAGATPEPGDVDGFAEAILALLEDEGLRSRCAEASRGLAAGYSWEEAIRPLLRFCRHPARSPDRVWVPPEPEEVEDEVEPEEPEPEPPPRPLHKRAGTMLRLAARGRFRELLIALFETMRARLERPLREREEAEAVPSDDRSGS